MATYKAIIRTGKQFEREDKTTNIKIRITHNRKTTYVATNYYCTKEQFDRKMGQCKGFDNAKYINTKLFKLLSEYTRKDIELGDAVDHLSATDIRNNLTIDHRAVIDFFAFSKSVTTRLIESGKTGTAAWHTSGLLPALKSFVDRPTLDINHITSDFLNRFEKYLYTKEKSNTPGGVNNYMRSFRSLFNQARDQYNDEDTGKIVIVHYPFRKYKIPQVKRRMQGKSLTIDEMRKIINYIPTSARRRWARDMFVLMFCCMGINSKDLYFLQKPVKNRLEFDRFKTGRSYSIRVEPEAAQIAAQYPDDNRFIDMSKRYTIAKSIPKYMNIELKEIAIALEINKPISSNYARHTWGTIGRNDCKLSKDDVALCLGHEDMDNKITDTYIDYDYTIQDAANRKVLDLVFNSPPS
jgi:integrase